MSVVYGFLKMAINKPAFVLPGLLTHATAIRFHPHLFKATSDQGILALPYMMLFAVATSQNTVVYRTDRQQPIANITNIHLDTVNDLCWKTEANGAVLI